MLVAGVDEVGRGPWAGPVVAAAVILPDKCSLVLTDSKKLTAAKREALAAQLSQQALVSIAEASVEEIDQLNIRQATLLAMRRALDGLPQQPELALIDGRDTLPDLPYPSQAVIKGDDKEPAISAASIVAKVYRDKLMLELAAEFPHYGWESNVGYGTTQHQAGLAEFGITPHHRKSFAPIQKLLQQAA